MIRMTERDIEMKIVKGKTETDRDNQMKIIARVRKETETDH